ncbi:protein of unknown function (DUF3464) [Rubidibacter lacunae KORDI 51-2]|uniref:DUF3464 family protein n=1 Tax=Rubidibacter lacunae KORDI 51-2 TaxID=582515 RepID=U5DJZ4_9CHRO|nr:PAM68 family protein [Rubidibacter lacunae]ERN41227.1 protein of unknown function (DUF3464) [Rubidibacter lacunae KORDI 51-2]
MSDSPQRDRLPFEPNRKRPKPSKSNTSPAAASAVSAGSGSTAARDRSPMIRGSSKSEASLSAIPEAVSQRMLRRMGLLSGLPTGLGIASFLVSYLIVSNHWFELPSYAVLLVSMGLFGIGVLGLSYGILSASWEEQPGSLVGWNEFKTNVERLFSSWRAARLEARAAKDE